MAQASQKNAVGKPLIEGRKVSKVFKSAGGSNDLVVLESVDLQLRTGEFVALLGRSGSGKSTLLRILAGLMPPTSGEVICASQKVEGPNPDVAVVFQNFALLPWLTVLDNVMVGLRARGVPYDLAARQAVEAIDMVGLDGFESAYPKELSGGMKQRVGFARAFVMRPKALFMDEPFSALDVLTAENLRSEISDLWEAGRFVAESVLMVTHNIEEAVYLADRIVVLGTSPGRVRGVISVDLARPRNRKSEAFRRLTDGIYKIMTNPSIGVDEALATKDTKSSLLPLPHVRAGGIGGFLEIIFDHGGTGQLSQLSQMLRLSIDDVMPLVDAVQLLGFAAAKDGQINLTEKGKAFALADILQGKEIFRGQILERVPLINIMLDTLRSKNSRSINAEFFIDILDERFSSEEAERQFMTAVDWARFAELLEYDAGTRFLYDPSLGGVL